MGRSDFAPFAELFELDFALYRFLVLHRPVVRALALRAV